MTFRLSPLDFGYEDILKTAPLAGELGFSRIWLAEHQAPGAAYADVLMMSMAVAATYPSVGPSPRAVCQMASTSSTSPIVR